MPWKARTAPDPKPDACQLVAFHVNAGRVGSSSCRDIVLGRKVDDALFQRSYQRAHANIGTANVDQRVDHELAGPVKRNLAAAIDLHDRNVSGREQMFLARIEAERENRWVFAEPDFVRRRLVTFVREFLHLAPQRHVVLTAEEAGLHSAIRTSS